MTKPPDSERFVSRARRRRTGGGRAARHALQAAARLEDEPPFCVSWALRSGARRARRVVCDHRGEAAFAAAPPRTVVRRRSGAVRLTKPPDSERFVSRARQRRTEEARATPHASLR